MAAPLSAYIGKFQFKKSTTIKNQWIAKFLMGTKAQGGYYDGNTRITSATQIAQLRAQLKQTFHLDEVYFVCYGSDANGFVGLVLETDTSANPNNSFHNMTTRKGHFMHLNGVKYRALNDAGLNTRGWGNVNFAYAFDNIAAGTAYLVAPFYLPCTYTLQFSKNGSTGWNTCNVAALNGSTSQAARSNPSYTFNELAGITEGDGPATIYWRMLCNNDEGQVAVTGTQYIKASVVLYLAEFFSSLNSSTYYGNGTALGLVFYKADYEKIIAKCEEYTQALNPWSRGDKKAVPGTWDDIYPATSWANMYNNVYYSGHAGYYLLDRDYGVQLNTSGRVTYLFYAYETVVVTPSILVVASFHRTYNSQTEQYELEAMVTAQYVNATDTNPNYNTTIEVTARWAATNGGSAVAGAYFNGGAITATANLLIRPNQSLPPSALFLGYATGSAANGVNVSVTANSSTLDWNVQYS